MSLLMPKKKQKTLFDKPKRVRKEGPQPPVHVVIPTFAEYADRLEAVAAALDDMGEVVFNVRFNPELRAVFAAGPTWFAATTGRARDTCEAASRLQTFARSLALALREAKIAPLTEEDLKRNLDAAEEAKRLERTEKWRYSA